MDDIDVRPLGAPDLDEVVSLDQRLTGGARRAYFERRLGVALKQPRLHLQIAARSGGNLVGFLLARIGGGEFGRERPVVVVESVAVEARLQHRGIGRRMLHALQDLARHKDVRELATQVAWTNHGMLRFLEGGGFQLAPRQILERAADRGVPDEEDEDHAVERYLVRPLGARDRDAVAAIDRRLIGRDRAEFLDRKLGEAMAESAVQVSLVAEDEGRPAGFAIARVDFGDFGHFEPHAALEIIGVDPDRAGRGIGRALLRQLLTNLWALHVERLETEVARETFPLLGYLYAQGFDPSQRLAFHKLIR